MLRLRIVIFLNDSKQCGVIMRKIMHSVIIGTALVLSTSVIAGSDGVEHAMKMMNKSYRELSGESRYAGKISRN